MYCPTLFFILRKKALLKKSIAFVPLSKSFWCYMYFNKSRRFLCRCKSYLIYWLIEFDFVPCEPDTPQWTGPGWREWRTDPGKARTPQSRLPRWPPSSGPFTKQRRHLNASSLCTYNWQNQRLHHLVCNRSFCHIIYLLQRSKGFASDSTDNIFIIVS